VLRVYYLALLAIVSRCLYALYSCHQRVGGCDLRGRQVPGAASALFRLDSLFMTDRTSGSSSPRSILTSGRLQVLRLAEELPSNSWAGYSRRLSQRAHTLARNLGAAPGPRALPFRPGGPELASTAVFCMHVLAA